MPYQDKRLEALEAWLETHRLAGYDVAPASGDASFRRYFRVSKDAASYIAMDAPPDKEDCRPFIKVAEALAAVGLNVPQVLQADLDQGFLLLTDLGNRQYLAELSEATVEPLYGDAMSALLRLQGAAKPADVVLPPYDHALLWREMELFRDWFLDRHLGVKLDDEEREALHGAFEGLAQAALAQPQNWVHRDYHSRNLMIVEQDNPGVLDFQDAVLGPVTYDLVSLLRDCYVAWPRERVEGWVEAFRREAVAAGLFAVEEAAFLRWFDLMGVQRHLKAIGIFARLNHRDGKPGYLGDIPRTLGYVVDVCSRYEELSGLRELIDKRVLPEMDGAGLPL